MVQDKEPAQKRGWGVGEEWQGGRRNLADGIRVTDREMSQGRAWVSVLHFWEVASDRRGRQWHLLAAPT